MKIPLSIMGRVYGSIEAPPEVLLKWESKRGTVELPWTERAYLDAILILKSEDLASLKASRTR